MMIRLCDTCSDTISEEQKLAQIGVWSGDQWLVVDVCGTKCALDILAMAFDDMPESVSPEEMITDFDPYEEEDDEPEERVDEVATPSFTLRKRDASESVDNEKRFKQEAAKLTEGMTGVSQRGLRS